jgi:Acyl-CoA thioesterase C-terminal domain/Acyl-CoA thioesterase N-terminal domain
MVRVSGCAGPRGASLAAVDGPPLFEPVDGAWMPSEAALGPWDPGALHGGPAAALVGRALETLPAPGPMAWSRVTLELLRPVPRAPLTVTAEVVRDGRRIQLAAATLRAGDVELCRATAWRVRRAGAPVTDVTPPDPPPGAPGDGRPRALPVSFGDAPTFGSVGVEARWVHGDWNLGPATVWMRLRLPVVAGERPTPLQRALALGDFGNGLSAVVPWDSHIFVNTELTVYLEREPAGEWLALDAVSRVDPAGTGLAESVLSDERGRVGRALQALYVDRRPPAPA